MCGFYWATLYMCHVTVGTRKHHCWYLLCCSDCSLLLLLQSFILLVVLLTLLTYFCARVQPFTLVVTRARNGEKEVPVCPFLSTFPFPLPFPHPFLSLPLICPRLPLEVGPFNSARGMGSTVSKCIFGIFWRLGNKSGRDNFNDFPGNQVTKFHALQSEQ